ncbi:hypothetical protein I4U23_022593 [Adineta vaga]|nr:hypothetical protein I4U23_022593 [Adineta vaga]
MSMNSEMHQQEIPKSTLTDEVSLSSNDQVVSKSTIHELQNHSSNNNLTSKSESQQDVILNVDDRFGQRWHLEAEGVTNKELAYISVVDLKLNKYLHKIDAPFGSENLCCSSDGQFIFLSTLSTSTQMSIVETKTDEILYHINLDYPPSGFIISPINSSIIYVRHMNVAYDDGFHSVDQGFLQEINFETKNLGRKVQIGKNPINIIITKNGKLAFISCGMSHRIDIVDLDQMELIGNIQTSLSPHGLIFAP